MRVDRLEPGVVEHRATQQMIALPFIADELAAQRDDVREVQVVSVDLAVALRDALEARIEAAPDVNHDRFRVPRQEVPRVAVDARLRRMITSLLASLSGIYLTRAKS